MRFGAVWQQGDAWTNVYKILWFHIELMMTSSNGNISALLAICAGNSLVTGVFPAQRPVTRSFDVFFDLLLNKRLSKQWWCWWFETLSPSLWRHCNVPGVNELNTHCWNGHMSSGSVLIYMCKYHIYKILYMSTSFTAKTNGYSLIQLIHCKASWQTNLVWL